MLEQLIKEIRNGGSLETRVLAARLGTSPKLIEAMLEHLQRSGLIQDYVDCAEGCQGCGLRDSCESQRSVRLWQSKTDN
jgi:Mn-dependent DtxR family transcriptional regulator